MDIILPELKEIRDDKEPLTYYLNSGVYEEYKPKNEIAEKVKELIQEEKKKASDSLSE